MAFGTAKGGFAWGWLRYVLPVAAVALVLSYRVTRSPGISPCSFHVHLDSRGLWFGPWSIAPLDESETGTATSSSASFPSFFSYSSLSAHPWFKPFLLLSLPPSTLQDGRADLYQSDELVLAGLGYSSAFNTTDPVTVAYARLIEKYLSSWTMIQGVKKGLGSRGLVRQRMFTSMAMNPKLSLCIAHVRILRGGRVFFRYGSFLSSLPKLQRLHFSLRLILDAITKYSMQDLQTEFFLNVCSEVQSMDNSLTNDKAGFPVFSTHLTAGGTDIPYPDPLELLLPDAQTVAPFAAQDLSLMSLSSVQWNKLKPMAVFRGPQSNFELKDGNQGLSPRLRLHRMADVRPDLLDARVTEWGPTDKTDVKAELLREGFTLGGSLSPQEFSQHRYRVVVDDAVSSTETCAALSSHQTTIRQLSPYTQFYSPLLLPGVHFVSTMHSFDDLFANIQWLNQHPSSALSMVYHANDIASQICSWQGRTLYWAVLLSKYTARTLEDPEAVSYPKKVCNTTAVMQQITPVKHVPPCSVPTKGACYDFCVTNVPQDEWVWLPAEAVLVDEARK